MNREELDAKFWAKAEEIKALQAQGASILESIDFKTKELEAIKREIDAL